MPFLKHFIDMKEDAQEIVTTPELEQPEGSFVMIVQAAFAACLPSLWLSYMGDIEIILTMVELNYCANVLEIQFD